MLNVKEYATPGMIFPPFLLRLLDVTEILGLLSDTYEFWFLGRYAILLPHTTVE